MDYHCRMELLCHNDGYVCQNDNSICPYDMLNDIFTAKITRNSQKIVLARISYKVFSTMRKVMIVHYTQHFEDTVMTMVKFDPFRGFDTISRRMFNEMNRVHRSETREFSPSIDISETEQAIMLHVEIPGIKKEDVKISIGEDRVLSIRGEKKRSEKTEEKNFVRIERQYGNFTRSFVLSDNINVNEVKAEFENGILEITLPKTEPVKPKEIAVEIQ